MSDVDDPISSTHLKRGYKPASCLNRAVSILGLCLLCSRWGLLLFVLVRPRRPPLAPRRTIRGSRLVARPRFARRRTASGAGRRRNHEPQPVATNKVLQRDTGSLTLGWVDIVLTLPMSARFSLGMWKFGKTGWTALWDTQFKINPTKSQTCCVILYNSSTLINA